MRLQLKVFDDDGNLESTLCFQNAFCGIERKYVYGHLCGQTKVKIEGFQVDPDSFNDKPPVWDEWI